MYRKLADAGCDVLLDDTAERPGAKLGGMDLIGIPQQVIIGPRIAAEGKVEWKAGNQVRQHSSAPKTYLTNCSEPDPRDAFLHPCRKNAGDALYALTPVRGFISVIAWFSLLGIALGVATLIIVMSVMNGFRAELVSAFSGSTATSPFMLTTVVELLILTRYRCASPRSPACWR